MNKSNLACQPCHSASILVTDRPGWQALEIVQPNMVKLVCKMCATFEPPPSQTVGNDGMSNKRPLLTHLLTHKIMDFIPICSHFFPYRTPCACHNGKKKKTKGGFQSMCSIKPLVEGPPYPSLLFFILGIQLGFAKGLKL